MIFSKLGHKYIWNRILYERYTKPLHLNFLSAIIAALGPCRQEIAFDLIIGWRHAYGLTQAVEWGVKPSPSLKRRVTGGTGLMNMEKIAGQGTRLAPIHLRPRKPRAQERT